MLSRKKPVGSSPRAGEGERGVPQGTHLEDTHSGRPEPRPQLRHDEAEEKYP